MSKWNDIKQFSKRTGITDPALDTFIRSNEVGEKTIERYSRETGLSDPVLDHFAKQLATRSNISFIAVDETVPDSEALWRWMPYYPDYRPHAAQRRFYENFRHRRRDWALSGIRAWDEAPLSEAEKRNGMAEPKPDGEKIDLIAIDEAREINSADNSLVEQLEANINRLHDGFRGQFYGGFGGMICHATREHDNYVDGRWKETPLKLPELTVEVSENWENPAFPAWLEMYR